MGTAQTSDDYCTGKKPITTTLALEFDIVSFQDPVGNWRVGSAGQNYISIYVRTIPDNINICHPL